ncbi:hypothetical protein ACIBCH_33130 [Amycolatopsis thailandensis]|uniref:hypothetical protein n=1 Tax=Amycolatopsis thailandensis TaxID=589330 RepID=UPI003799E109
MSDTTTSVPRFATHERKPMWAWFVGGYAVLIAVLIAYSAHVAISCHNKQRRADAFKVLKLLWVAATGTTGLALTALRLHESGILP